MDSKALLFLSFAAFFFSEVYSTRFTFRNNCPYTVWPATLTGGGGAQLPNTGFELAPQATASIDIPSPWSGRFWARSWCSVDATGRFSCQTADCASGQMGCNGAGAIPPASLAEFTLGGYNGQDFYDVSLVDGFNLPLSITPQEDSGSCATSACAVDINIHCPPELAVGLQGNGAVIACKSACLSFNQPQFCCTGAFGSPQSCPPTSYSNIFKSLCPQAYSYAYDDKTSTFTCSAGANYLITICP